MEPHPGASLIRQALQGLEWSEILLDPSPPLLAPFPPQLLPSLQESLRAKGFEKLYEHQALAAASLLRGQDTILVTGTSSGKTLAYALPVLQTLSQEPMARALFVYPTKALAQDQLGKLKELAGENGPMAAVYDGDTPKSQRAAIRAHAQIIITNPDMLHLGILPAHELWRPFFRSLRHVVLDEAHTLRGVFGSHSAWLIRRLLRLCDWMGSRPVIAAASATVPNPAEFFLKLTGRRAVVVAQDASPKAVRSLFLVSIPLQEEEDGPTPNTLTARIMASLASHKVRSLAFCRSRLTTELVVRYAREMVEKSGGKGAWMDSYRGGYTPRERRSIEKAFFTGKLRALASTDAMELGVDVGGLDAVILNGYPGSVASFWQQAGRTGRSGKPGSIIYIPHEDALEQYILRKPDVLFAGVEPAVIFPGNPVIASGQLQCAAFERPLDAEEPGQLWPGSEASAQSLIDAGQMARAAGRIFYNGRTSPAGDISIRGATMRNVTLLHLGDEVGEMEEWRALQQAHPGAIYLHRDMTYIVEDLDLKAKAAFLRGIEPDYATSPLVQTITEDMGKIREVQGGSSRMSLSVLKVTTRTHGFQRFTLKKRRLIDTQDLDMPSLVYSTVGAVLNLDPSRFSLLDERTAGVIHSIEHLLLSTAPLLAGCDPRDVQSSWALVSPDTLAPQIVIFDHQEGGMGFSEALYEEKEAWLRLSLEMAESCPCEEGCPRCLMTSRCGSGNQPLDKQGAMAGLAFLIQSFGVEGEVGEA